MKHLFNTPPETGFAFEGNAILWDVIANDLQKHPIPNNEKQFASLIRLSYKEFVGVRMEFEDDSFVCDLPMPNGELYCGFVNAEEWRSQRRNTHKAAV